MTIKYTINPHKHVKIWFSKEEGQFLNPENQLRLVQFRAKNPDDEIHFVYAKRLLSQTAMQNMNKFCSINRIIPVCIEEDVAPYLQGDEEKRIYTLAQQEIQATQSNRGGNLGAASDLIRILPPVFKKGIYSDFDVNDMVTNGLPDQVEVEAPIIYNLGTMSLLPSDDIDFADVDLNKETVAPNNDILAFSDATEQSDGRSGTDEQQTILLKLYRHIIAIYENPCEGFQQSANVMKSLYTQIFPDEELVQEMTAADPNQKFLTSLANGEFGHTVFEIRKKINAITPNEFVVATLQPLLNIPGFDLLFKDVEGCTLTAAMKAKNYKVMASFLVKGIKESGAMGLPGITQEDLDGHDDDKIISKLLKVYRLALYKLTVTHTTGPASHAFTAFPNLLLTTQEVDQQVAPASFAHYPQLQNQFKSSNGIALHAKLEDFIALVQNAEPGKFNDLSWVDIGANAIKIREKIQDAQAKRIQTWYQKHAFSKHGSELVQAFKTIYHALYAGQSSFFKTREFFVKDTMELTAQSIREFAKNHPKTRTAEAWKLALKHCSNVNKGNGELFSAIHQYAYKHSSSFFGLFKRSVNFHKQDDYGHVSEKMATAKPGSRTAVIGNILG